MKNVLGFSLLERFDVNCHILFLVPHVFLIQMLLIIVSKSNSVSHQLDKKTLGKIKLEFLFVVVL